MSECPLVRDKSTNMDNPAHRIMCFSHLVGDERNVLMLASRDVTKYSLGPALHKFEQH